MVTPLPIPNRAVKHRSTDDTHFVGKVGSRQNQVFNLNFSLQFIAGFFCYNLKYDFLECKT